MFIHDQMCPGQEQECKHRKVLKKVLPKYQDGNILCCQLDLDSFSGLLLAIVDFTHPHHRKLFSSNLQSTPKLDQVEVGSCSQHKQTAPECVPLNDLVLVCTRLQLCTDQPKQIVPGSNTNLNQSESLCLGLV